jgi:Transposase and inactivated derivatives
MQVTHVGNFIKMFEQSIGVEEPWYIDRAGFEEADQAVHIYVRARETAKYACPECGKLCTRYDNEDKERIWRHGDVVFYPCYVHCRRPRVKCKEHGIHVATAPWARPKSRFTLLFEAYAMLLLSDMPVLKVQKALRCGYGGLVGILRHWVEKAVVEDDLSQVRALCVDETSFKRGQSYVTVVIDGEKRRVIDVEEGRGKEAVEAFSYRLEKRGGDCNKVRTVASDMSGAYLSAREECFPQAISVIDKFHVKKVVLDAMEQVRRGEQKLIRGTRGKGRKLLMIPENKMDFSQQEAAQAICKAYPKTGRAYRMVQTLDAVYASYNIQQAESSMNALIRWMRRSRLEPMKAAANTLKAYKREILAYFAARITNAIAEGINSMIQAAKRKARGYRTFRGFACMIHLIAGKLSLSCGSPFA